MIVNTDTKMPSFGVAKALMPTQPNLFEFWLLTHSSSFPWTLHGIWPMLILRECLPPSDAALEFEALAEPLQ